MYAQHERWLAGCFSGEIVLTGAGAFWTAGAEPQETATPWPTPTRLVPPNPTPRATVATPIGASNLMRSFDSKGSFTTKDTKNTKSKHLKPFVPLCALCG